MQQALFFIFAVFAINSVSSCSATYCYDGHGADPKNWKKVECNFGTCVKIQVPLDEQRYCLQGTHALDGTCTNSNDHPNEMSVSIIKRGILSLKTIFKARLLFFF